MKPVIWHNPKCSKSRQTLELMRAEGFDPTIVEYLKIPPTKEEIASVLDQLKMEPRELMRTGEAIFKELQLASVQEPDKLIAEMHENPILIERPVVIAGNKAALGRPPEHVLTILK